MGSHLKLHNKYQNIINAALCFDPCHVRAETGLSMVEMVLPNASFDVKPDLGRRLPRCLLR